MKSYGIRESCQDTVCPGSNYNWDKVKMRKCYSNKADAIHSCCDEKCLEGLGYETCMSDCRPVQKNTGDKSVVPIWVMAGLLMLFLLVVFLLVVFLG